MATPRLLIEASLTPGAEIALNEAQSRHLVAVLRKGPGDEVRVFNARDGEWSARVQAMGKRGMTVQVAALLRESTPTADLDLLFAPVKRHATDLIVEKAVELGVRRIRPVLTERTIVDTVRLDRLRVIAREAAEQCERLDAPEICEALPLAKVLDGWDTARALLYADEAGDDLGAPWGGLTGRAPAAMQALRSLRGPPPAALAVLIGPEGGFSPGERRALRALEFVTPVSLGPRILRAETAAIALLTIAQAAWGDWRTA